MTRSPNSAGEPTSGPPNPAWPTVRSVDQRGAPSSASIAATRPDGRRRAGRGDEDAAAVDDRGAVDQPGGAVDEGGRERVGVGDADAVLERLAAGVRQVAAVGRPLAGGMGRLVAGCGRERRRPRGARAGRARRPRERRGQGGASLDDLDRAPHVRMDRAVVGVAARRPWRPRVRARASRCRRRGSGATRTAGSPGRPGSRGPRSRRTRAPNRRGAGRRARRRRGAPCRR